MSEVKLVVASVVKYLKRQLEVGAVPVDSREGVEVAVQCLEAAFEVTAEETARGVDLGRLVRENRAAPEPTAAERAEADRLKNEGNELMKNDKYNEALELYTRAIALDANNAVYYCNRAAAHYKLGAHDAAVADCTAALALQPDYGKAHGRLGLALAAQERHREARASFGRASQLEPDNESYRTNLRLAHERVTARQQPRPAPDLGGLLHNPALLNMATEILANPNMQNLITGLMSNAAVQEGMAAGVGAGAGGAAGAPGAGGAAEAQGANGLGVLLEAGQLLAQQMQATNPELVEMLRRQVTQNQPAAADATPPAPPSDQQPPPPTQ